MRGNPILRFFLPGLLLSAAMACLVVGGAPAAVVSFSGTVTYNGSYAADTLYVAVLDTNTVGSDPTFLVTAAIPVGSPPLSEAFSLSFDNALATGSLIVAAALDVDGGGLATIGGGDVVGWYASTPDPELISPATSHSGLDFFLPRAQIHGTVTFGPDQIMAFVYAQPHANCLGDSFQPQLTMASGGPYSFPGLYAGTYCVGSDGMSTSLGWLWICYGDPLCANPTPVTLTATQVVNGVDLDFSAVANELATWGAVKSAYR